MRHAKQSLKTMPRQYSAVLHASACFVQEKGQCSLQQWQSRLDYYVYETVGQLRMTEMFDIVVDYPDSRPAVQDVKDCLAHTNLHRKFVAGFKQAIGERLLHAGHTSLTPSHHHTQALSNTSHCTLLLLKAALHCCVNVDVLIAHCLHVLYLAHFRGQADEHVS